MSSDPTRRDVVVVGTSSGGIAALRTLVAALPAELPATVVVVMHLSAHTRSHLESTLQSRTTLRVATATDGAPLEHGVIYVPVPDRHTLVTERGLRLTRGPRECRARPAIDVLFRSAAVTFGPRVIGVVLTGQLDDGTAGLWAIKDRGGLAFVQDPALAEYASMPDSAMRAVDVDFVGGLDDLAMEIARRARERVPRAGAAPRSGREEIENRIANEESGLAAGILKLGPPSVFTCPQCHGALMKIEEGRLTRYRCHTGHAYSPQSLLAEVDEVVDNSLWDSLRALEERVLLLRHMADLVEASGNQGLARKYRARADDVQRRLDPIESLLHDGHTSDDNDLSEDAPVER